MSGRVIKPNSLSPCLGRQHPDYPELFYMDMEVVDTVGCFSGYVPRDVATLVEAAPDLLALARQYASECGDCNGAGTRTITTYPGGIEVDNDDQPCEACANIRKVIDKATKERA